MEQVEGRTIHQRQEDRVALLHAHPALLDRWRQRDGTLDETALGRYRRGERYAPCLLRIDRATTAKDIAAQLLAYVLQEAMVPWDEMAPWVRDYVRSFTATFDAAYWFERMITLALPWEANALRPPQVETPPGTLSLPQAARALGMSTRQLRYFMEKNRLTWRVIERRGACYFPQEEVERLQHDEAVKAARVRHAARQRRQHTPMIAPDEEAMSRDERIRLCREVLESPGLDSETRERVLDELRRLERQQPEGPP